MATDVEEPPMGRERSMIARMWTARAPRVNAPAYREHFETAVVPELRQLDGYVGASLLLLDHAEETEIVVVTRWRSVAAIGAFAGGDVEAAVVADEAQQVLVSWDRRVRHYTIAVDDNTRTD